MIRCPWAKSEAMIAYHDQEWGTPVHDDRVHFEFLMLEGAQAGLTWELILNRRENYRKALAEFDPVKVARFTEARLAKLLLDPGIIRNRLKIASAVSNAKAFLATQKEFGSFDAYIWRFVDGHPIDGKRKGGDVPAKTSVSDAMSKDLKKRGFSFVGSTICYAYMQAVGLTNDHLVRCFRHAPDGRSG